MTSRAPFLIFAIGALAIVGALVWGSGALISLEAERQAIAADALRNERVSLAVWRAESLIAPVVAGEAARPHFHYRAFYSPRLAYTRFWEEIDDDEIFVPSPILTAPVPWIRLHFQLSPEGAWSSPQVPTGNMADLAESAGLTTEATARARAALETLIACEAEAKLVASLERESEERGAGFMVALLDAVGVEGEPPPELAAASQIGESRGQQEWSARRRGFNRQVAGQNVMMNNAQANPIVIDPRGNRRTPIALRQSSLVPVWLEAPAEGEGADGGPQLVLVRRVAAGDQLLTQGVWVDWDVLERLVRDEVADIFPDARLLPRHGADPIDLDAAFSTVPADLLAGELAPEAGPIQATTGGPAPVLVGIGLSWGLLAIALIAVGLALAGLARLSRRRLEFVSAVTHELRTPLTTFQMYTDMLAEGMVRDEEQRQEYYTTLRAESERLGHLVQNVLEYSRLEAKRFQPAIERTTIDALLDRCRRALEERCSRADLELEVTIETGGDAAVETDPAALERILFNLVDNACKYAAEAEERHVRLSVATAGPGRIGIAVDDGGPGLDEASLRSVFEPFVRGAARPNQPGIGLGLALARRWARELGGDLEARVGPGGHFRLFLRQPSPA